MFNIKLLVHQRHYSEHLFKDKMSMMEDGKQSGSKFQRNTVNFTCGISTGTPLEGYHPEKHELPGNAN